MSADRIAVGRVTRAHGVHGEVAVQSLTDTLGRFDPGSQLRLEDGSALTISGSRPHGDRMLVSFEGIADRASAEGLRDRYLFIEAAELPPLPEGSFWPHQLEGCEVVDEAGASLGVLTEVLQGPANDVWVVDGTDGRRMVPAVSDAVVSVDVVGARIVVREEAVA